MLLHLKDIKGKIHPINPDHVVRLIDKTVDPEIPITGVLMLNSEKSIKVFGTWVEIEKILENKLPLS